MQLDQILSAAVAAVNEVQQLPSPDVPQYSPTPPASAAQEQQPLAYPAPKVKYEVPDPEASSTRLPEHTDSKKHNFQNSTLQETETSSSGLKNAFHIYNEALQEAQDAADGFGDISFFTMDDDNLVITSQQALEMFESKPDDIVREYRNSHLVLHNAENPPEINTPPIEMTAEPGALPFDRAPEEASGQRAEAPFQEALQVNKSSAEAEENPEEMSLTDVILEQWPVYLESEIPVANGALQVTEVTEEVPQVSSEVEVLTSMDTPQYTSLTPAVTQPLNGTVTSLTDEMLQNLPGSSLDATVDANGHFVVQVVAPGMNMTVQNEYVGREEEVVSETPLEQQGDSSPPLKTDIHQRQPIGTTGPYATYNDQTDVSFDAMKVPNPSPVTSTPKETSSRQEPNKRSSVLTALRESIYRSQAKKRRAGENHYNGESSAKRKPADILEDLQIEYEHQDSTSSTNLQPQEEYDHHHSHHHVGSSRRQNSMQYHHSDSTYYYPSTESFKSRSTRSPSNEMMVLRPEELQAALQQKGRHSNSTPLVVMRPDDLHSEGGDGNSDPLQVQLVYLVYPMDGSRRSGSGSQSKRMPSEMISNAGFPRDMPSVQPPTASTKTIPWLHGDGEGTKSTSWLHGDAITPRASHSSLGKYCSSNSNDLTYKQKPIHTWQDQDIMYFMFDATKELKIEAQDIICSQMAGLTGKDLIQMNVDDFKKYCPRTAELMYQHFRARLQEERAQQQQAAAARAVPPHQSNPNHRLGPEASPVEFITQSSNFFPLSHQHPSHPPDMLMTDSPRGCDIPAPYEIHTKTIETIDHRLIGIDEVDDRRLSGGFPSASRKSFPLLHAASPVNPYDVEESISEPEQSIEEVKPEPPKKRGPGRPRKPENELKKKKKKTGRLWEFIRNLLLDPETCPSLVRWENAEEGIFKFVQADKVAQKWGERKQNKEMNYEKLSRAMRYYYKGGVFEAVFGRRLVYKFGKNAKGWQPSNPNFANRSEPYLHSSRR